MDLCDANQVWTTGWRRLRADGDGAFRDAVEEAAALHAHDELFAKHVEPEPAPEDPVEWAMVEPSDGEEHAPMPDAPPEPELIDMPPAPPFAPPMTNLERCIALRLILRRWPTLSLVRKHVPHVCRHMCPVLLCRCLRSVCPAQDSLIFFLKKKGVFFCCFSGEVGSDGVKWCPHKVISAHVLAFSSVHRP